MCCRVALNISGIFRTRENLNLSSFIQSISPVVGVRCGTSIRADPMAHTHPPHSLINGNGSTFQKWFYFIFFYFFLLLIAKRNSKKGITFIVWSDYLNTGTHSHLAGPALRFGIPKPVRPDFGYLFIKKKNYAKSR